MHAVERFNHFLFGYKLFCGPVSWRRINRFSLSTHPNCCCCWTCICESREMGDILILPLDSIEIPIEVVNVPRRWVRHRSDRLGQVVVTGIVVGEKWSEFHFYEKRKREKLTYFVCQQCQRGCFETFSYVKLPSNLCFLHQMMTDCFNFIRCWY